MAKGTGLRKTLAAKFDDELKFFKGWIDKPKAVGAIVPTSSVTARRMASVIDLGSGLPVLELGPGTGVITKAILRHGVKPENLYAKVFSWLPETIEPQDDCLPEESLENPGGEKNGALLLTKLGKMKDFDLDAGLRALRGDHVRYTALLLQFAQ